MECCICSNQAVFEVVYRDSFGVQQEEVRCEECAKEVIASQSNTVISKEQIERQYSREAIQANIAHAFDVSVPGE